jgi:hypothetical protein
VILVSRHASSISQKSLSFPAVEYYFPVLSNLDLMQVLKPAGATVLPACAI